MRFLNPAEVARLADAIGVHPGQQRPHGVSVGELEPEVHEGWKLIGGIAWVQGQVKPWGLRTITVPSG